MTVRRTPSTNAALIISAFMRPAGTSMSDPPPSLGPASVPEAGAAVAVGGRSISGVVAVGAGVSVGAGPAVAGRAVGAAWGCRQ